MRNIKTRSYGASNFININGKRIDVFSAKIVYRCEMCLSPLAYRNSGLVCSKDKGHRGFIHRNQGARQAEEISIKLAEIEEQIWKIH